MTLNDRLALELGRVLLRAVYAEERTTQLEARLAESKPPPPPPKKRKPKS